MHLTAPLRVRLVAVCINWPLGMKERVSLLHLEAKAFPACCNLLHKACTPVISGIAAANHNARLDLLEVHACRNFQMTSRILYTLSTGDQLSRSQKPFALASVLAPDPHHY